MRTEAEQRAYDEGWDCFRDHEYNNSPVTNPYVGVDEDNLFRAWKDGYYDAAWDN